MQVLTPALGPGRLWRRVLLFVPLSILFYSTYSLAQDDVAEEARQERARKAAKEKHAPHVYSEEDLKRNKILTPEDQARVEARKKRQNPASGQQNAENLPVDPTAETESLGDIARRYRLEKAAREAAEAAKKSLAPFPYEVPTQHLAAPKPNVAPLLGSVPSTPTLRGPELPSLVPPRVSGNAGASRSRISPFQPRPLLTAPRPPVAQHSIGPLPRVDGSVKTNSTPPVGARHMETAPADAPPTQTKGMRSIQVQRGDSWWKLAERYLGRGSRWPELRTLNPDVRAPAEYLQQGTVVLVPELPAVRTATPRTSILIAKGDTLWALAREHLGHGSSWVCLAQANPQISDYTRLAIGSTLQLPTGDLLESCKTSNNFSHNQR